ncbi:MAG: hypothetical protein AABY65_07850 [Nitrospirota bacterium]
MSTAESISKVLRLLLTADEKISKLARDQEDQGKWIQSLAERIVRMETKFEMYEKAAAQRKIASPD